MKKNHFLLIAFLLFSHIGYAQFDVDPASLKWKQIKTNERKIIFPDYYEEKAKLINLYFDILRPYITHNLSDRVKNLDVVLHPVNTISNGFVAPFPFKMELFTAPGSNINFAYSPTWLQQLVAHEYRHAVQYSNLDVGSTRFMSYLLGDASVTHVSSFLVPFWYFEGEAVMFETQMSMNGRAEQPYWSLELRALLNENIKLNKTTYNKWSVGSFKDFTPSIYNFGYFTVASGYKYYGDDYWKNILNYTGRRALITFSNTTATKQLYDISNSELFVRAMEDLRSFWHEESQAPNSSALLDTPIDSYTTYSYAQYLSDDLIIAKKQSYSEAEQIVLYDKRTAKERRLEFIPYAYWNHDKIIVRDSSIYWSEYKSSIFWGNDVSSVIKRADLYEKNGEIRLSRPEVIFEHPNCVFITPVGSDRYALVCYDKLNNPSIELFDKDFNTLKTFEFEGLDNSFNGLAYDEQTSKLCYALLENGGTTIGTIDVNSGEREIICGKSYMSFTNLSAQDGKLFFGSTESGKDEVHMIDLRSKIQYQITSSQYGSFAGIGGDSTKMAISTYTIDGYMLAEQRFDIDTLRQVDSKLWQPNKKLVVPVKSWGLPKLDTIDFSVGNIEKQELDIKKYNKTANLFGAPYAWGGPAFITPTMGLVDDLQIKEMGFGVNAMFQNPLNTMIATVGYGWVPNTESSLVTGMLKYQALPVHVELGVNYGGRKQEVYGVNSDLISDTELAYDRDLKKYFNVDVKLSMPMRFSGGTNSRNLVPFASFSLVNSKVLNSSNETLFDNSTKMRYGVSYDSYSGMAKRDLAPRLGYSVLVSGMTNPVQQDFGHLLNVYAGGYLPGLFKQHSLAVAVAYQYQFENKYNYVQEFLFPRGNDLLGSTQSTFSTAVNYIFPIASPDLIIPGLLNIRRIYFEAFGEYAQVDYLSPTLRNNKEVYTVGGEIFIRFNGLNLMFLDFTLGLSAYKPSQSDDVHFGTSFRIGF